MIRVVAVNPEDGSKTVLFGLTARSLEKMVRDEQPIVVNLSRLGDPDMPDVDIAIFYANEDAVKAFIQNKQASQPEGEPPHDDHSDNRPRQRRGWKRAF